jgi:hypothetical protein
MVRYLSKIPFHKILPAISLLLLCFSILSLLPSFWVPIGLPHEGDSLNYRIPILKWMLRHGTYPNWPFTFVDDYPMFGELLMLPFFAISPTFARIVPIFFYICSGFFAAKIAEEFFPSAFSAKERKNFFFFLFANILALHPLLLQSNILMVDNIATAFTLASIFFYLRSKETLSGLTLGLAMASRYSIWGAAIGGFFAHFLKRKKIPFRFFILIILCIFPFIFRNFLYNHNPVFPIFSNWLNDQATFEFDRWGRGKGILDLLLFPFDLLYTNSFERSLFDTNFPYFDYFIYTVGTGFSILSVVTLFVFLKNILTSIEFFKSCLKDQKNQIILSYSIFHFFYWWVGSQQLRFIVLELLLIYSALLFYFYKKFPKFISLIICLTSFYSITNVHLESWKIAFGISKAYQDLPFVKSHLQCLERISPDRQTLIAHNKPDTFLGFGNYDFVFLPPHAYATSPKNYQPQSPDFIFDGENLSSIEGYSLWPKNDPCVWKKN